MTHLFIYDTTLYTIHVSWSFKKINITKTIEVIFCAMPSHFFPSRICVDSIPTILSYLRFRYFHSIPNVNWLSEKQKLLGVEQKSTYTYVYIYAYVLLHICICTRSMNNILIFPIASSHDHICNKN